MKKHSLVILSLLLPLLFTSCLADYLNEKFGFTVPVYISYSSPYGNLPKRKKVYPGTELTEEDLPKLYTKEDESENEFLGWFLDDIFSLPAYAGFVVNENITLYGKWELENKYDIPQVLYIYETYVLDYRADDSGFYLYSREAISNGYQYTPQEVIGDFIRIDGVEEIQYEFNYFFENQEYDSAVITRYKYYNPTIDIDNFQNLLNLLPDSTTDYTYYIKIEGSGSFFPSTSNITNYEGTKMIHLDISGYITSYNSFMSSETFADKLWLREVTLNIPTGASTFINCYNLEKVNLLNGVSSIGNNAFENCRSLTSIKIPKSGASSIGSETFKDCISLREVFIPENITTINSDAFYGCSSLEVVYYEGNDTSSLFANCSDSRIKTATWITNQKQYWQ